MSEPRKESGESHERLEAFTRRFLTAAALVLSLALGLTLAIKDPAMASIGFVPGCSSLAVFLLAWFLDWR